jgi:peptidyl-prolyl cis-trans isomerase D
LKAEVLRDKKADLLMGKLKSVKSIAQAKSIPGALTDSLNHVTFSASAFVTMTNASEPALSGSVAKAKVGSFSGPVKGNAGVYVYQVMSRNRTAEKFDERKEEMQDAEMNMRGAGRFMNDLFLKANVKDKRYLFF